MFVRCVGRLCAVGVTYRLVGADSSSFSDSSWPPSLALLLVIVRFTCLMSLHESIPSRFRGAPLWVVSVRLVEWQDCSAWLASCYE